MVCNVSFFALEKMCNICIEQLDYEVEGKILII